MATTARIYIVRHGETEANRTGIIQGQMDTDLNGEGLEQAKVVGDLLAKVPFEMAFCSDLRRAAKTAEVIVAHHPQLRLETQEALRERYMGDIQGKSVGLLSMVPASAESATDVAARAMSWWNTVILQRMMSCAPEHHDPDGPVNVLVVSHGGFIRSLVNALLRSRKLHCADGVVVGKLLNTSVTVIDVDGDRKGTLVQFGDISHLNRGVVETNADEVV